MIYLPNGKFRVNIFIYSFIQRRCIKLTESDGKVIYIFLNAIRLNVLNKESL